MELVGVYAHGADKVGVDAADLSGWSEPTGVTATDDIDARNFDADTGSIADHGPMTIERHFLLDHFRRLFWIGRLYVEPKPAMPNPAGYQMQQGLYITRWEKASAKYPYSPENTGYTLAPVKFYDAYVASTPTTCQMKRPGQNG